jgi:hypothetical protein
MWNKVEHDFGTVPQGAILNTSFTYNGNKGVQTIEPLCNCVGYTFKDNMLRVTWKVKKHYPKSQDSNKVIMIVYSDDSIDDLTLKAHVQV